MPIYEYQAEAPEDGCEMCRGVFEYIQAIGEKPLPCCPHCGSRIRKLISWCRAAVMEPFPEDTAVEKKIGEYEKEGLYSHAAELADKRSDKTKDNLLKERALENYKKAGYDFDSSAGGNS